MNNRILIKLGFNTIVQSISRVTIVALSLLSVAILSRYLGVTGYGNYSLVFAYLVFFGAFSDVGFHVTVINEINKKTANEKLYGTYFWIKVLISILTFIIPILILFFFPYSPFQKNAIIIGAIAFSIGNFVGFGNTFLQSRVRLDLIAYIEVLNKAVTFIFIALFVLLKTNLFLILTSVIFGNLVSLVATFILVRNYVKISLVFDIKTAINLTRISLPIGIASILSLIYFRIDTIMISVIKGTRDVGIYSLSYRIFENLLIFWAFYVSNFYPLISKFYNENRKKDYSNLIKSSIKLATLLGISIITFGFVLSPLLIKILGGVSFSESVAPLRILLFSAVFFFINNLLYYLFFIRGRSDILIKSLLFALLVNIGLNFILVPKYSYIGASFSTIATEVTLFLIYFYEIKKNKSISL